MKNTLKIWTLAVLILFLFPILLQLLPAKQSDSSSVMLKQKAYIVYASNVLEAPKATSDKKVLLHFTHSEEAYEPITLANNGKVAVSHKTENITKLGEKLQLQFTAFGVEADLLPVDIQKVMAKKGIPYHRSYKAIRPYLQQTLADKTYDIVLDIHRDSVTADKTTVTVDGERYAKVAFVIGKEHKNYTKNYELAKKLTKQMESRVPGITRNIIVKGGPGVDGKYNQDLHPGFVLVELGGIGNNEEELNRTVAVIAEAVAASFVVE
ncbi:stage II sporulation protein P [Sporosarcina sp. BI001-red]|uniref:stage II sporulation protein P n=1 Tax=Sporosarcina sp. BI001-red TaxID=2282866 RepID=UPI000E2239E7|nr:stage II sporulation protein P [Sporosarcina sp. BI001-red]REB09971.1 stage II sporulation protein P [Sporosarcina sp. BI001-red]